MSSCDNSRRFEFTDDHNDNKVSVLINEVSIKSFYNFWSFSDS